MWKIQVFMMVQFQEGFRSGYRGEWRDVHPTGGKPYIFDTKEKALEMRYMCYPEQSEREVRIFEVK